MLKIGDFSKLSRISVRMLRHYDEIGLLVPESIDTSTGYRHYGEAQLLLACRIQALKDMGFGLSVITEILHTYHDAQALRQYLLLKKAEIREQMEKTSRQLLLLETTINRLGEDENTMEYSVTVKEMPKRTVASLRSIIPAYEQEGLLWAQLQQEIAPQKVRFANPCHALAVYHDQEYKEQNPDIEIQITVEGEYQSTEHVAFKTVEPILIASATFRGGYEQIGAVNEAVTRWITDNQYDFDGCMFNIYHVGPAQSQDPGEWITEACFPVKKK